MLEEEGAGAGNGTPQRDFHLLQASCLHQGWRYGVTFFYCQSEPRASLERQCHNICFECEPRGKGPHFYLHLSQSAGSYFIL